MINDFTYFTHPDNVRELKRAIDKGRDDSSVVCGSAMPVSWFIEIKENPLLDRDQPTGKYVTPTGIVPTAEVRVVEQFWEYGPEDIPYLLYAGIIHEQREMLVLKVARPMFRVAFDAPPAKIRSVILSSYC